jgi:hypothetical protein
VSVFRKLSNWWSDKRSRVRDLLAELPDPRQILAEANAWHSALTFLGNRIHDWEPEDTRVAQFIRENAQLVEIATGAVRGLGGAKAEAVMQAVRAGWRALDKADDAFDAWWEAKGKPLLDDYVTFANAMNGWKVP